jgi:hypothetical protein
VLAVLVLGENVMAFVNHEHVTQHLTRCSFVLAEQQEILQDVQAKEALLVITKPLQLKHHWAVQERRQACTSGMIQAGPEPCFG